MRVRFSAVVCSLLAGVLLSACAGGGAYQTSGVTSSASVQGKKPQSQSCAAMLKQLRKLEGQRKVATPVYDRILDVYLNKNCYKS